MNNAGIATFKRQRGMGMLGWLFTIFIGGFCALTILRAAPLYYDYWVLKSVVNDVAKESASRGMNKSQLWNAISSRLFMNSIQYLSEKDFTTQRLGDSKQMMRVSYEARAPLVGNLELLITFDHQAVTQ